MFSWCYMPLSCPRRRFVWWDNLCLLSVPTSTFLDWYCADEIYMTTKLSTHEKQALFGHKTKGLRVVINLTIHKNCNDFLSDHTQGFLQWHTKSEIYIWTQLSTWRSGFTSHKTWPALQFSCRAKHDNTGANFPTILACKKFGPRGDVTHHVTIAERLGCLVGSVIHQLFVPVHVPRGALQVFCAELHAARRFVEAQHHHLEFESAQETRKVTTCWTLCPTWSWENRPFKT